MYIKTWSQFINKKHLINEAVKLAVTFFEDGKIQSEIFRCRRVFVTEMLANRGRSASMFVYALMQVPLCKANITCIAQVTLKLVNKRLLDCCFVSQKINQHLKLREAKLPLVNQQSLVFIVFNSPL